MSTRSALLALLREAGVDYIEKRRRVLVDMSTVTVVSLEKFHDLSMVYLAHKFSDPDAVDHFKQAEAHASILHFPIVIRLNGVFANLKFYNWLVQKILC